MLVCISIHADTDTLCFRTKILKRVNSSELVVQKIVYLANGRQMLQEYQGLTVFLCSLSLSCRSQIYAIYKNTVDLDQLASNEAI